MRVGLPIADLTAGNLLALGDHDGALRPHAHRRRPLGAHEPARSADLHARLPGRALADREGGREAGRQRSSDRHSDGRVPDERRPLQHRRVLVAACSPRFCDAIGKPEWKDKDEWNTGQKRSAARKEINAAISEITRTKPSAHWVELFEEAGVPCGPIYTIDQVFADPQVQHLGMAAPVKSAKHGELQRRRLTDQHGRHAAQDPQRRPPTPASTPTRSWAASGYTKAEIEKLRANGVV